MAAAAARGAKRSLRAELKQRLQAMSAEERLRQSRLLTEKVQDHGDHLRSGLSQSRRPMLAELRRRGASARSSPDARTSCRSRGRGGAAVGSEPGERGWRREARWERRAFRER